MQNDLNQCSSDIGKKWDFDFSKEQPLNSTTDNSTDVKMNKMSWEPVKTEDVSPSLLQATRPRLQITKPKMNISFMLNNNTKPSTPGLSQVYGQGFGLDNNRSSILFGQSNSSESTVGDSMFSASQFSSVGGTSSICCGLNQSGLANRRTSISQNLLQIQQTRRNTEMQRQQPEEARESQVRESMVLRRSVCSEEGSVQAIKPAINAGGKCFAEVNAIPEEFKDSVESNVKCDSNRSGSGSASGRQFNVLNGFTEEDGSRAPFEPVLGAQEASEHMNNA